MKKNTIIAVAIALTGSAIFGCLMAFRPVMPEPWMRSTASFIAFSSIAVAFLLALKFKSEG